VAGVLQDTDRAVVVGERSYGKGLVQVVEPLPGGGSLKLTVAKYYTPSGRCIQAVSYGGGRVTEARANLGSPSASSPLSTTPESIPDGAAAPASAPDKPAGSPSNGRRQPTVPGAVRRIDPSEPSLPTASAEGTKESFLTAHGRKVISGGGIAPDVIVEGRQIGDLERSLIQQGFFFDFAGDWLQRHAAPTDALAALVERSSETSYSEFVEFVRAQLGKQEKTIEPAGLQRQLDALQATLGESSTEGGRVRSSRELQQLRKLLQDEQLLGFRTEKTALALDVREALLGRLTPPSVRLAEVLQSDPQVLEGLRIAGEADVYDELLRPAETAAPAATAATAEPMRLAADSPADQNARPVASLQPPSVLQLSRHHSSPSLFESIIFPPEEISSKLS